MDIFKKVKVLLLVCSIAVLSIHSADAQKYVRYVKPEDFGTKTLYADSVLTSITLPRGVGRIANYPQINAAAYELSRVLEDSDKELMQVWVCGSTSPDGLWGDNVELSQMRTDAAAAYLRDVTGIPESMIHKESLNEDWDRLIELVTASDIPYKYEVLYIIRSKKWGERKTALQKLDGGRVWDILEKDFFPQLRCVRFAILCKWDPSKPYLSAPKDEYSVSHAKKDTIYVRDTVYMVHQQVVVKQTMEETVSPDLKSDVELTVTEPVTKEDAYKQYRSASLKKKKYWDTPWKVGIKTNVIADAMAIPMAGLEFQVGNRVSLNVDGWYSNYNIFCKGDDNANIYGFSPEIRFWGKERAMERGSFFGIHGMLAWYTLLWSDGFLYQNGGENQYQVDAGNAAPAWSVGLTYGYSFALDRKANWGLEVLLGLGYGNYSQNRGVRGETTGGWNFYDYKNNTYIGITRAGINLTYRFSVRKVKPEYYER